MLQNFELNLRQIKQTNEQTKKSMNQYKTFSDYIGHQEMLTSKRMLTVMAEQFAFCKTTKLLFNFHGNTKIHHVDDRLIANYSTFVSNFILLVTPVITFLYILTHSGITRPQQATNEPFLNVSIYLETCFLGTAQREPLTRASPVGTGPLCSSSRRSPAARPHDEA